MTIYHIITYSLSSPSSAPPLAQDLLATATTCFKPDGKAYIGSVKGGRFSSTYGDRDHLPKVVFVLQFENRNDLEYFVDQDQSHILFKTRCETELGVLRVETTTFEDGVYQTTRPL
ncbi:hypothetical protein CI109_105734 [Kwoniella shandongensis]|uniref:Uncharacterized protein n=1 Tax=Kwoniella shandongensis TaxID=1734106 RepID=A0A5M6C3Z1_9TREE|nr:uncharacterized protein CI109_003074 [Kwoniella shandongensis]KAA5528542.1 hypothetical protein CI109_003074 [Kwoniella shandongensis]